jgi:hypothetical protein
LQALAYVIGCATRRLCNGGSSVVRFVLYHSLGSIVRCPSVQFVQFDAGTRDVTATLRVIVVETIETVARRSSSHHACTDGHILAASLLATTPFTIWVPPYSHFQRVFGRFRSPN